MRPSQDIQEFRSKWRIASVFIGAMAASWLLTLSLPPLMIGVLATNPKSAATNDWRSCWRSARNNICHTFESMVYYASLLNVLSFLDTLVQRTDSCKYRASFQRTSARDLDRCRIGVPNWCCGTKISNTTQVRIINVAY
jgi:hypothetical protein